MEVKAGEVEALNKILEMILTTETLRVLVKTNSKESKNRTNASTKLTATDKVQPTKTPKRKLVNSLRSSRESKMHTTKTSVGKSKREAAGVTRMIRMAIDKDLQALATIRLILSSLDK